MTIVAEKEIDFEAAAQSLRAGDLVAFPTETVYGLGADATNDRAVATIFEVKGRPQFNPLIVHVSDLEAAQKMGQFDEQALRLAEAFWPGPLTLVVPRQADCAASLLVSAGLETIALRVPAHPLAHQLLQTFDGPIAAPSANISGQISPTLAVHVAAGLGDKVSMILDGSACPVGLESTIVGFDDGAPVLLRPGGISRPAIEKVTGPLHEAVHDDNRPQAPGGLASHYAPKTGLRLDAKNVEPGEALLAFGGDVPEGVSLILNLSVSGDLTEAAANLFAGLHILDAAQPQRIAVMPIPDTGLGEAINDRLRRAAAPRP